MLPGLGLAFELAIGLALAGIVASAFYLTVIRQWSEGSLNGTEALSLGLVFLVLFGVALGPVPLTARAAAAILIVVGSVWLLSLSRQESQGGRSLDRQMESRYRSVLERDPNNVAAMIELGRTLYRQRRIAEAIAEMERAIELSPKTTEDERRLKKYWTEELEKNARSTMICRWCREETPRDLPECRHCGRPTSELREVAEVFREETPSMIRAMIVVLPAVLILGFLLSSLGPLFGSIAVLTVAVGCLWWIHRRMT